MGADKHDSVSQKGVPQEFWVHLRSFNFKDPRRYTYDIMVFVPQNLAILRFLVFTRPLCVTISYDPASDGGYSESGSLTEVKVQRGDAGVTE